jgi:hypothetical protein
MSQSDSNPKRQDALSFINGNKFGVDTWTTIFNFGLNTHNIILTIGLYSNLIEEVDKGNMLTTNSPQDIIRMQQHIVLDAISKIQILIESTLVLVHSLSIGYHAVAKNITYYNYNLLDTIIKEISKNKKLKNYKYNLRKVLGLPNLKYLSLSLEEKKLLNKDFQNFELNCLNTLKELISFYDKFNIVYGKSKHGLAYITGGSSEPINKGKRIFDNSVLNCYGRINRRHKMPKETIVSSTFSSNPTMQYKYYNFISVINFNTKLIEEINSTLSRLNDLISFVCTNHELCFKLW